MTFDLDVIDLSPGWEKQFLTVRDVIKAGLKHAQRQRELTREQIAEEISKLTRQKVTKSMIDKWTREDGNGHRFPHEYAGAFAEATGDIRILIFPVVGSGLKILTPKESKKYRAYQLRQEELRLRRERERIEQELSE